MIKLFLPVLMAPLLAGCADDDALFARNLTQQSEACREHASQLQPPVGPVGTWSTNAREADFERNYRTCMAEKGFNLGDDKP